MNALLYLRVSTARQAHRGGEAEGYSLPAQREACIRKAAELGAQVVGEYVDAGASARSADRDGLQALLGRLADKNQPPVSFVIVHKLDRLARDRADDVSVLLAIRQAGAQLISVSEQIDETPAGMLLHGIMASIAEFYSHNLSAEAKKGLAEKAKRGGTIGYAPTGYLNSTTRLVGDDGVNREVKTVIHDPDRAPHIAWAFEEYSRGHLSLTDLTVALAARGLTSRDSRTTGKSLSRASVHRMLSNPYYVGKVVHRGVSYDGKHQPLVDAKTFARVQDMLAGRKIAGDRSWRREHYLKGTVHCITCGSRLGYSHNRGTGGVYEYFFCLGRAKKRTNCDLPYLPAATVEDAVLELWQSQTLSPEGIQRAKAAVDRELTRQRDGRRTELKAAHREVTRLTSTKQRLLDAYLAEAVSLDDFQQKQADITAQLALAQQRLDGLSANIDLVTARLDIVLSLLARAGEFYASCPDDARQLLNHAMFDHVLVGPDHTQGIRSQAIEGVVEMADNHQPQQSDGHTQPEEASEQPDGTNAAPRPTRTYRTYPSTSLGPAAPRTARSSVSAAHSAHTPRNHPQADKNSRLALVGPDGSSNLDDLAEGVALHLSLTFEAPRHLTPSAIASGRTLPLAMAEGVGFEPTMTLPP